MFRFFNGAQCTIGFGAIFMYLERDGSHKEARKLGKEKE